MDQAAKKQLLRTIPYGLYAACTRGDDGDQNIFILSWVTQASFDPPLMVACVHKESRAYEHLTAGEREPIAINLLGDDQAALATEILKGAEFHEGQVAGTPYQPAANGCAALPETLGVIEAEVIDEASGGDHAILVLELTQATVFRSGEPLTHETSGMKYAG